MTSNSYASKSETIRRLERILAEKRQAYDVGSAERAANRRIADLERQIASYDRRRAYEELGTPVYYR